MRRLRWPDRHSGCLEVPAPLADTLVTQPALAPPADAADRDFLGQLDVAGYRTVRDLLGEEVEQTLRRELHTLHRSDVYGVRCGRGRAHPRRDHDAGTHVLASSPLNRLTY